VTGVRVGTANLVIPSGTGYNAPADWYFPTQADGTVAPNGVIWLQHGFLGFKDWYADLAIRMAQETNSIVVAPSIFWFDDAYTGEAAAQMFLGDRAALNISANQAGLQGTLPEKFLLTGHSAGGRFATTAGAFTVDNGAAKDLLGVVMFDGVSSDQFAAQLAKLDSLDIPDYQIAAPPQRWNAWGVTTEQLAALKPGEFVGIQIDAGSHTDSIGGDSFFGWLGSIGSDIVVKPSPPGGKEAVGTFATGWINDMYGGFDPTSPVYGIYGNPNNGTYVANRPIVMGQAGATTLPAPPPVDIQQYAGTWYEQGSVKQFFSFGLVNTKAVYTPQPDGSIKVENSGNYFGPNGPESTITGAAVPVNSPTNTRLNVGFGFGQPNDREPGNYWIVDYAPDYSWVIVSDSTGSTGFILTRDQTIPEAKYNALVDRAKQLGVRGRITPTEQFPPTLPAAVPGPGVVPATVTI
jgi:lipocalin